MSRSGYSDDCEDNWSWICWRGAVKSAIRGKRGQAFLRETLAALDALPERKLIAKDLIKTDKPKDPDALDPFYRWPNARSRKYGNPDALWMWDVDNDVGAVCTLGAVGVARNIDMTGVDPEDHESVAGLFNIPHTLACEIMFMNDEAWWRCTPEERWVKMRAWIESEIRKPI